MAAVMISAITALLPRYEQTMVFDSSLPLLVLTYSTYKLPQTLTLHHLQASLNHSISPRGYAGLASASLSTSTGSCPSSHRRYILRS